MGTEIQQNSTNSGIPLWQGQVHQSLEVTLWTKDSSIDILTVSKWYTSNWLKLLKLCTVQCTTQTFKVSTGLYFVSHLLSIRFHNFGCNGCVMSKPAEIQFGPWWKMCSKPFTCHSLQRFSSGAAGHTFHLPCSDLNVGCHNEPALTNALRSQRSCGTQQWQLLWHHLQGASRCHEPRNSQRSVPKFESSPEVAFSLSYLMLFVSFLWFG